MDWSAPHVGFTLAAYLVTAAALLVLAGGILLRARKLRSDLAAAGLEDKQP